MTARQAEAKARGALLLMHGAGAAFGLVIPFVLPLVLMAMVFAGAPIWVAIPLTLAVFLLVFGLFLKWLFVWRTPAQLPARPLDLRPLLANVAAPIASPDGAVLPADLPPSVARLDRGQFAIKRRDLQTLGFVPLGSFHILDTNGALDHTVYDVWAHPVYLCYGVILQDVLLLGQSRPVRLYISSGMGDRWWFFNADFPVSVVNFLLRTPRTLWERVPGASADALLRAHLEKREDICGAIGRRPEPNLSLDSYINGEAIQFHAQRQRIRRISIFVALYQALFFGVMPRKEWTGDLEL